MFLFLLLMFSKVMAHVKTISMHGYPEHMKKPLKN